MNRPRGGFLSGAGYSWLTGLYGLGVDNVIGAEVVLASGRVVRCSADQEAELFWSIRGGSSNFGVITEFQINAFPHPGSALTGVLIYDAGARQAVYEAVKVRRSDRRLHRTRPTPNLALPADSASPAESGHDVCVVENASKTALIPSSRKGSQASGALDPDRSFRTWAVEGADPTGSRFRGLFLGGEATDGHDMARRGLRWYFARGGCGPAGRSPPQSRWVCVPRL
ncbi:MAG: FAD-binding oxidoreductase [Terriglobus roseus]|nr:FAD-binding oxidoreductase [Terriglobus roseus]